MAKVIADLSNNFECVPTEYVLPPEKRPQEVFPADIPVIDLSKATGTQNERRELVEQLIKAGQEYGIFQVINHGVGKELIEDTMGLYKEFFELPYEEISKYTVNRTPLNGGKNGLIYWKDAVTHSLRPLEEQMKSWPEKPPRYREVVGEYVKETVNVASEVLELIAEGLGIEKGYFKGEASNDEYFILNYYPPCPDPSLTLGLYPHADVNLLTILQQDVSGLQILKDSKWFSVALIPNAFVINIATQLQVISNGKLRSPDHRVVTNPKSARTSICIFVAPSRKCIVGPAKALINESNPPVYKSYTYEEFMQKYKRGSDAETAQAPFKH